SPFALAQCSGKTGTRPGPQTHYGSAGRFGAKREHFFRRPRAASENFNELYISMVKAGELGGVLEVVLTRLAEFQEKAQKVKGKVLSAMIYPAIVMTMAVVIMGFLLVFIVPRFEAIFKDMLGDKPLPGITIFVI